MKRFGPFLLFLILVFAIYLPLIDKSFSSDDFQVLRRIVYTRHSIFIKGFFRPLSDITLYGCYLLAGFHPVLYNIFNFITHSCIVYILFLVAGRISWVPAENRSFFSWLTALLFLTYPFHNEPILWGVGRGSLLSNLFAVLAMLVAVSAVKTRWKYFLVCLFYFIAMSGYETVMVLPGIILLLAYDRKSSLRSYTPWAGWLGITLVIHLVLRVWVSGVFFGEYGAEMIETKSGVMKYIKVAGRVLLPPMENSSLLTGLFVLLALVFCTGIFLLWKKRTTHAAGFGNFLRFGGMLLLALFIPMLFGMSTRTYEGDRLFYFSSDFVALLLAWMITALFKRRQAIIVSGAIIAYQFSILLVTVHNWYIASGITKNIIATLQTENSPGKRIYVANIPEEYHGAHIFRNGFYDALWMTGIDTSTIRVVNFVRTEQWTGLPRLMPGLAEDGGLFIPPYVTVTFKGKGQGPVRKGEGYSLDINPALERVFYWDGNYLEQIK
ncbi:MAG TPA: hypothetical protein VGM41_11715 [Chitinophagaceae bacterium]